MTIALAGVTTLGIMPMLNLLYFSKDSEFFFALPVSQSKVYFAKLFTVYITQLVITAVIILPALFTVGIMAGLSWAFFPSMILATVMLPCFPLMIISVICLPIMYVIRFFKNRGAAASIMAMALFVGLFAVYMAVMNSSGTSELDETSIIEPVLSMAKIFVPLLAISRFATFTNFGGYESVLSMLINFLIFIVPAMMLFAIALIISRRAYFHAVASQLENQSRSSGGSVYQDKMSSLKALMLREWKLIWRTPVFSVQCFAGLLLTPIILIVMGASELSTNELEGHTIILWLTATLIIQALASMNIGASTSFSRDGESFFLNKLLPISYQDQIKAKIILYNLIYGIVIVICIVICYVFFGLENWWIGLMLGAYTLVYNYGFISLCILIDLSKPKLDWRSYREIVKNSRNAVLPALVGFAVSAVVFGFAMVIYFLVVDQLGAQLASILIATLMLGGAVAFAFIVRNILSTNAKKYFDRIEA